MDGISQWHSTCKKTSHKCKSFSEKEENFDIQQLLVEQFDNGFDLF